VKSTEAEPDIGRTTLRAGLSKVTMNALAVPGARTATVAAIDAATKALNMVGSFPVTDLNCCRYQPLQQMHHINAINHLQARRLRV